MAPAIQYGKYGAILTLETLGQRWGWEKTKVWRFMKKHGDVFALYRLSSSYVCLIFNKLYPCDIEVSLPTQEEINDVISTIKQYSAYITKTGSEHEHLSEASQSSFFLIIVCRVVTDKGEKAAGASGKGYQAYWRQ